LPVSPPHIDRDPAADRFGRRESLVKAGGLAIAVLGASAVPAGAATSGTEAPELQCVLAPEMTEGPFYIPREKVRRNVREGEPGVALALRLGVVDSTSCRPIAGAAVDIWHADAGGHYSGFNEDASASRTFLRGIQRTDATGIARFDTIYPGWYPGRAVHIHVKVHLSGNVVHTGQLFFDDALTDTVFSRKPYSARGARDTRNRDDSIFLDGGRRSFLHVQRQGTGYLGTVSMGVHRS
jgi:protocatechuate 3,4-dioxygenase beta subunit